MITVKCECGEAFEVPESTAGGQELCPSCQAWVDVPGKPPAAAMSAAVGGPAPVFSRSVHVAAAMSKPFDLSEPLQCPGGFTAAICRVIGFLSIVAGIVGLALSSSSDWLAPHYKFAYRDENPAHFQTSFSMIFSISVCLCSMLWFAVASIAANVGKSRMISQRMLSLYQAELKDRAGGC